MYYLIYSRRIGYTAVLRDHESFYTERYWRPTIRWARWTAVRRIEFHTYTDPGGALVETYND